MERVSNGLLRDAGDYLDTVFVRHPLAQEAPTDVHALFAKASLYSLALLTLLLAHIVGSNT